MHPLEAGCFELLSEVPDVGDKAKQLLFPVLLSLVMLAVLCELSAALVVLILVFLINLLALWLSNHVGLSAFPKRFSPGCSLFAVTRSLGSHACQEWDGCPQPFGVQGVLCKILSMFFSRVAGQG